MTVFEQNSVATFPSSILAFYQTVFMIFERLKFFVRCSNLILDANGSPSPYEVYYLLVCIVKDFSFVIYMTCFFFLVV